MNLNLIISFKVTFVVSLIILTVPIIFFGTTAQMVHIWNINETFTHGYLIFPITLWLIWNSRRRLAQYSIEPELRPLLLLVMILVGWFLGGTADVQVAKQMAMIGLIPVLVWLLLGRNILLVTLFPVCYLFFAIPIGQSLIPPLMEFTADFTVYWVQLSGIPIYREGFFLSLPSGEWSVVEGCSGVRYLIASLALGTIYAYTSYQTLRKRILFVIAAAIVPIIANGFRAYGIVMIGHLSGMELATGVDHLIAGWIFFGVIIFVMFYIGSFWRDSITAPVNDDQSSNTLLIPEKKKVLVIAVIMTLISIVGIKSINYQINKPSIAPIELGSFSIPENFEAWQQLEEINIGWGPIFQSPDITTESTYRFGRDIVQLNIAYYSHQRQGVEAVSTQNRIINPYAGKWKLIRTVDLQINKYYVSESEIGNGEEKILVWHWYRLGDKQTPNPYIAKMFEIYNQIIYGRHDAAIITVAIKLNNLKEDRSHLQNFVEASSSAIGAKLKALVR